MLQSFSSIETRDSWIVASAALVVMMMAFGAAWIIAVALKDIAGEIDGMRSIPALASALAWLGSGAGGIMMSRIADRVGTRWTVICGSLMIGLGLVVSTLGRPGRCGSATGCSSVWSVSAASMRLCIFMSAAGSTASVARRWR